MGKRHKNKSEPTKDSIEVTVGELVQAQGVISLLHTARMPARLGLQVRRIVRAIAPELEVYNETRKALLDRYAAKDKAGELVIKDHEYQIADREAFDAEYNELLQTTVAVDLRPLKLDDLNQVEVGYGAAEGLPPVFKPWKPMPVELDAIMFLLDVGDE